MGLVIIASYNVDANPVDFAEGLPNLSVIVSEIFVAESIIEDLKYVPTALWAMLETIQMAFIGTVIGVVIGLPLSMLAARNLNSKFVYAPTRALLAIIRTFPSILWALLFVIMVGLGPYAGVLAIVMYTIGFVTKLQYESIETIDSDPMDAVSSIGVSKFFEYGKAAIFMLIVLITVLAIDWISVKIRDKYIIKSQHGMEIKSKESKN